MSQSASVTTVRIWRAPIVIAVATSFGLGFALVVDGAADAAASLALAIPVAVVSWFVSPRVQLRRVQLATASARPPKDGSSMEIPTPRPRLKAPL